MSNKEIRDEARDILARGWYGKIASVFITLYCIMVVALLVVSGMFAEMNVQTLSDHLKAKLEAAQAGLAYAAPSHSVLFSMTGASIFMQMVGYLFGAIFMFGMATVLLKALKNDSSRWFTDSFGGFSRPLEVLWLIVLMNIKVFLWTLLFVIPGFVAIYRYRQAWYLKSENPDWSASKCLAESGRMMKGRKWAAFRLDLSFFWVFLLTMLVFSVIGAVVTLAFRLLGGIGEVIAAVINLFAMLLFVWLMFRLAVYFFAARAVFYKAIGQDAECPAES